MDHRPPLDPLPGGPSAPRRRGRGLLWVGAAFAALVAIGFVVRAIAVSRAGDVLRTHAARAQAELDALRDPARALPGLPALLPGASAGGDAADVVDRYVAAVAAIPSADRDTVVDHWSHGPKAIDAALAKRAGITDALLPVLSVAGTSPRPPTLIDEPSSKAVVLRYHAYSWARTAAARALAHGDAARARRLALALMAFAHDVARGGTLLDQMVGLGFQESALRLLVASLASSPISGPEAAQLRRALEVLDDRRFPASRAVDGDRAAFRHLVARAGLEGTDLLHRETGLLTARRTWRWLWSEKILLADAAENADVMFDAIARAATTVDGDPRAAVTSFPSRESSSNPLIGMLPAPWSTWVRARTNVRALNAALRARLAVAEWTAAKGSAPAALSDLVPEILSAVPTDPWTNAPLRYDAGKVWSEGRTSAPDDDLTSEPRLDDEVEYGEDEEPEPAEGGAAEEEPAPPPAPEAPRR